MKRSHSAEETVGKAAYAAELAKVKVVPVEGVECRLVGFPRSVSEPVPLPVAEPYAFRLLGVGYDEATFFVARHTAAEEANDAHPLWIASEVTFGAILPHSHPSSERQWAVEMAVKFALRFEEDERPAMWDRMKAFGAAWRAKR